MKPDGLTVTPALVHQASARAAKPPTAALPHNSFSAILQDANASAATPFCQTGVFGANHADGNSSDLGNKDHRAPPTERHTTRAADTGANAQMHPIADGASRSASGATRSAPLAARALKATPTAPPAQTIVAVAGLSVNKAMANGAFNIARSAERWAFISAVQTALKNNAVHLYLHALEHERVIHARVGRMTATERAKLHQTVRALLAEHGLHDVRMIINGGDSGES